MPSWIDSLPRIAHNKAIVVDGHLVIGGSYNYTASAEHRNAENVHLHRLACRGSPLSGELADAAGGVPAVQGFSDDRRADGRTELTGAVHPISFRVNGPSGP